MDLMYIRKRPGNIFDNGYLRNYKADFDISTGTDDSKNDFEIEMDLPQNSEDLLFSEKKISSLVFVEGTEFGGHILGSKIDLEDKKITYTGKTWRGMLNQYIIEPPAGEDYLIVSGNLAETIRSLPMNPLMSVKDTSYSGGTFQFDRYISTQEGINKLLAAADPDLRFMIAFTQTANAYTGVAELEIVRSRDLTSLVEVSQDLSDTVGLTITRDHDTPRHLICLGRGELHEREVIHLYADADWHVQDTAIAGAWPVETYDFSSSEALRDDGIKHFNELIANHKQIDVSISDSLREAAGDVRLGDVISAQDVFTGERVQAEINNIVYKCTDYGSYQQESYEYKTKVRL